MRLYITYHHIWIQQVLCLQILILACLFQVTSSWPKGTYGLAMPKSGCPKVENFAWSAGARTQQTEKGSTTSEKMNLAGLDAGKETNIIIQNFCIKTSHAADGSVETWDKGKYCILKKGTCPEGFSSGWIFWDDHAKHSDDPIQDTSGSLPDGEYTFNTKISFCCRMDGAASKAIKLPSSSPFYLYMWGEACQKVENMNVNVEWVYWTDSATLNLNNHGGIYPRMDRMDFPVHSTKIYYCYYTNKSSNNTVTIVVCVIVGVLSIGIFICIAQCIMKHVKTKKKKESTDPAAREEEADSAGVSGEPSVIYRRTPSAPADDDGVPNEKPLLHGPDGSGSPGERLYPDLPQPPPDEGSPMLGPDGRPMSLPPSYDDVLREDGHI